MTIMVGGCGEWSCVEQNFSVDEKAMEAWDFLEVKQVKFLEKLDWVLGSWVSEEKVVGDHEKVEVGPKYW